MIPWLILVTLIHISRAELNDLQIVHQWKYLDWLKPNVELTGKKFILGNPITQDVEVDVARGRVFVTSPHWLEGNPITLSVVTRFKGNGGPLLKPYPDWTWHRQSCDGIISVYRIAIDECNRLWIIDNGNNGRTSICPQKLLIFDLRVDKLLHKYEIPASTSEGLSQLVTPIVEIGAKCVDAHLFVADVMRRGLLVYSLAENRSWRWNNTPGNAFGYDEDSVDLNIAGEAIQLRDGILGMSLSPKGFFDDQRYLFFNSMASYYEKFATLASLKNESSPEPQVYRSIQKRISQAGPQATSRTGAVFFQLAQITAIACWNMEKAFIPENIVIVAQDEETLQYTGGIKVKVNRAGVEELWFNTNRLQKTIKATRSMDEVNFRVIRGRVDDLIKATNCEATCKPNKTIDLNSWQKI